MKFIDRSDELNRLEELSRKGGLGVVWGRRRVGKTRLLLEWAAGHDGLYTVADQSAPPIQREFLSEAISKRFPGFSSVEYPNWRSFLDRLASGSARIGWTGPIIFDEFPYLIAADSTLASVFQNWIDHEAMKARLTVAIAGSSQRMMQGLVLDSAAPLYGRSRVQMEVKPLPAGFLQKALKCGTEAEAVAAYAVWGGTPRYWELAENCGPNLDEAVDHCVLDPLSPLFREPERLLLQETPPAISLRPLLDLIGAGVHRVSELAGRLGIPSTSLSRPLSRLVELGLVNRELPYGDSEKKSKRSLYRISDPFFRLWFRVVAPNKAFLTQAPAETRKSVWRRYRQALEAETWEELCRSCVPLLRPENSDLGGLGPWAPARRYWRGNDPEWDIVARSVDGRRVLLGEAKWSATAMSDQEISHALRELMRRGTPPVRGIVDTEIVYALFTPEVASKSLREPYQFLVDAEAVLASLK